MHTKDYLAGELRAVGLIEMADRAAEGYYHDYLSPLDLPCLELAAELKAIGTPDACALLARHLTGEFDASMEEGEAWPRSPDGEEAFNSLLGRHAWPRPH